MSLYGIIILMLLTSFMQGQRVLQSLFAFNNKVLHLLKLDFKIMYCTLNATVQGWGSKLVTVIFRLFFLALWNKMSKIWRKPRQTGAMIDRNLNPHRASNIDFDCTCISCPSYFYLLDVLVIEILLSIIQDWLWANKQILDDVSVQSQAYSKKLSLESPFSTSCVCYISLVMKAFITFILY